MVDGVIAYIGIGSNLGDPLWQSREALRHLAVSSGIVLQGVSSFYKTEPVINDDIPRKAPDSQEWFVNAVAEIRTALSPRGVLNALQLIEKQMGRTRDFKGAPRIIDLDLLLYGQEVISEGDLTVPHPRLHRRRFVLEPFCEIASYVIHPAFGVSMRGLCERLDDRKAVLKIQN